MVDVGGALISSGETPEAIEPCEVAFDNPAVPPELFLALDALAGNMREDAALAASFADWRREKLIDNRPQAFGDQNRGYFPL